MNLFLIKKTINYYRENKAIVVDTVVLIVAIITTGIYLHYAEATESFYEFTRKQEYYDLDEIILTIAISSFYLLIYTLRRFFELKRVMIQANTDPLIGILNRRKGSDLIKSAIDRSNLPGKPSSIIMFDIDNFKSINDTYGHDTGDYVLKKIASITKKESREFDVLIRWGGEEFMILCPKTNSDNAYNLAERLRKSIENHQFKDLTQITASFGVTALNHGESLKAQIDRADGNLYKSKKGGRNKVTKS